MSAESPHAARRVRWGALLFLALGAIGAAAVLGYFGLAQVLASVGRIGWRGLAALSLWSLAPFLLLGGAWRVLDSGPGARLATYVWSRMARDSATELLPFSQFGGFVVGARAAVLGGVVVTDAFATTVVDVTAEMIAQLGFTALGIVLLVGRLRMGGAGSAVAGASLIGLVLSAAAAAGFILAQRRGGGPARALARRFLPAAEAATAAFGERLDGLYRRPARLALAVGLHLAAWIASALGIWIALRAAGLEVAVADILAVESLVGAVRSAAFFAPMAIGVQEATYALVGPLFGLPAELALAISLVRRGRDVVIGLPVLLVWQFGEGRRLIAGRRSR